MHTSALLKFGHVRSLIVLPHSLKRAKQLRCGWWVRMCVFENGPRLPLLACFSRNARSSRRGCGVYLPISCGLSTPRRDEIVWDMRRVGGCDAVKHGHAEWRWKRVGWRAPLCISPSDPTPLLSNFGPFRLIEQKCG